MWKLIFQRLYKCSCYSFFIRFPHVINTLFPRHCWILPISSTYVDIVVGENLFHRGGIGKMLKERFYYPQFTSAFFKVNFWEKNKISFTAVGGHLFPPYFQFYRGFYTAIVEKKRPDDKNRRKVCVLKIPLFYSHFPVDCEKWLFHICV